MAKKPSHPGEGGFQHKPLAGLAGLRSRLPSVEPAVPPPEADTSRESSPADSGESELGTRLVVQRERKKRGGKTVTRIRGLELDDRGRTGLAKELAKALGCGTSLDGDDILVQGAQVDRAADWLERRGASQVIRGN